MRFAARHMDAAAIRGGVKRRADSHLAVLRGPFELTGHRVHRRERWRPRGTVAQAATQERLAGLPFVFDDKWGINGRLLAGV
jgi:hypothetical protein